MLSVVLVGPDVILVNTTISAISIVLPLVMLFLSPLKRTQIISKLIKINKLLRIVQFSSFSIAFSLILILGSYLDFLVLEGNYWMFLTGFFLMVSLFFIFSVSTFLSVNVKELDEVFWHLFFIHYPVSKSIYVHSDK